MLYILGHGRDPRRFRSIELSNVQAPHPRVCILYLVGVESEPYMEEHYRQTARALVSPAMSSASHYIDL